MNEPTGARKWLWRILDFINPLRDPSLTVAAVLTFIEEAGQHNAWYWIIVIALINWLAVRGMVWLVVNFTFASVFIARRVWWAIKHPHLAWRIMDAVGHEEIVIGGFAPLSESVILQDGTAILGPALSASGIHIIGELPAGTELPMVSMANGQLTADLSSLTGAGFFPGAGSGVFPNMNGYANQPPMNNYQQIGQNGFYNQQSTDGLPQSFSQRPSENEERLRQQLEAYSRLLEDWVQFTEEKWRTVSDSQLGWKPLRGRWGDWEDIFQDAYAAKTSDPMAQAAQSAGEATARRFETSKEKGSAASAVACFMRDMMTLRRGIDLLQQGSENSRGSANTTNEHAVVQPLTRRFGDGRSGSLLNKNGTSGGGTTRNSFIRRPAQIFVDADSEK